MSELKARTAYSIVMEEEDLESSGTTIVYLKSDVDKVIAELERRLNEAHTELELWRDGSIISEEHQKELEGKRHTDYKRCLAMAKWCDSEMNYWYDRIEMEQCPRFKFYEKWHKRWLELAEQFKKAK